MTIHKRGFANYREKLTSNRSKYRCELFIYVIAYQPSSYTELMSRQHLMLKTTLRIL